MAKYTRRYELPAPSTESVTDASLCIHGRRAIIRFDYFRDGKPMRSGISFLGVSSTRSRSERCCTSAHIKPFDALIEYADSEWARTQRSEISELYRDEFVARHYSIYLDSVGCFEVLAEGFEVVSEEEGSWAELSRVVIPI